MNWRFFAALRMTHGGIARLLLTVLIVTATVTSVLQAGEFDNAIDAVLPRVVKLYGVGVGPQAGYGSGVLISEDGLVVTVFSLLIDANRLRAVLSDGASYDVEVVARDARRQLALLQLKNTDSTSAGPFPFFDIRCRATTVDPADRESAPDCERILRPGDWILAAGNAFKVAEGSEPISLTHGVFSTRTKLDARRRVKEFPYKGEVLVIDAITSNPGAPGGAVVNVDGELVGLIGREVISNLTHTHFNYAMPRDIVHEFVQEAKGQGLGSGVDASLARLDEMVGSRKEKQADPGIRLTKTGYKRLPPMVDRVQWGSPAEKAGVRKDDVILSLNGRNVPDIEAYDERLALVETDEPIDLVIQRGDRILSLRIEPHKNVE